MADSSASLSQGLSMPISLRSRRALLPALGLLALCILPFIVEDYFVFRISTVMGTAIALLGLNLLTGYNGQISLGHGAFYAIGAYTTAILMDKVGLPYWTTVPMAGAVCLVFGMLFGLPALKLEGLYLALATFALGVALPQLLKYRHLEPLTGGVQGITLTKPDAPFGLPLSPDQWLYFFAFAWLLACFWFAKGLLKSHTGRAIVAIRDQPIAAVAMGIDVARVKTLTFGVSAMYTGIAGALGAIMVQFVAPDSFTIAVSIELLVGIVVGGIGQLAGAIFGAFFIRFVPPVTEEISKGATGAIYGLVLIAFVYLMPYGIAGFIARLTARLRAAVQRRGHE
jgi:branched-chain amino acid transport system permease protein